MPMCFPYISLSEHIAAFVAEEDNAHGADKLRSEVDGENVETELPTASSPGVVLDDDAE